MEGEPSQEHKNEQLETDIAGVNHLLSDYSYEPIPWVNRDTRKQWEFSENPDEKEKFEKHKMNMYRANNIQAATLIFDIAAMTHFKGTDLEKKYTNLSLKIINKMEELRTIEGTLVPTEIVNQVHQGLKELKADLEALRQ